MSIDPTAMYLHFGHITGMHRTISLISVATSGNAEPVSVTKAIRGKVSWRVLQQTNGAYVRPEALYSIPLALAPGPWKPGDILTDASQPDATEQDEEGTTYRVQTAEADEGFWNLSVFNPKIAFGLKDTCTILALTEGRTTARTRTTTTATAWANVACRIQPARSLWAERNGRVGDLRVFDVFLDADYAISPTTHLIQWTDDDTDTTVTGDIRDVTQRQRIDEVMRLTVELRVGP